MPRHRGWLLKYIGRRGATLLILAILDAAMGVNLLTAESSGKAATYRGQIGIFPLEWWGTIWLLTATILVWSAFRKRDAIGFALAGGITIVWSLSFLISFLFYGLHTAWVPAILWMVVATWVRLVSEWPEERNYE